MKFTTKLLSVLVIGSLVLMAGCSKKETLKSIQLDPEADEVLVDTNTDIRITTDPKDIQLTDSDFQTSGATIKVTKNSAKFSASETGTYTISAKKDKVSSNTITVVQQESNTADSQENDQSDDESASSETAVSDTTSTSQAGESTSDAIDVATILSDPQDYAGKTITIIGSLPQTPAYNSNNDPYGVIFPTSNPGSGHINDPNDRLRMSGENITIGGCIVELTGTLTQQAAGDDQYVFNVTSFEEVSDESAQ